VAHRQSLNLRNGIELTLFRKIDGHLWTRKEVFYLDEIVGITNTKHTSYDSAVREWPNRHLANGLWIVAE
jgi:hypothetical protein